MKGNLNVETSYVRACSRGYFGAIGLYIAAARPSLDRRLFNVGMRRKLRLLVSETNGSVLI